MIRIDEHEPNSKVAAAFLAYEWTLVENAVVTVDGFFLNHESAIRYDAGENLHGNQTNQAFRLARSSAGLARRLERTQVMTYGYDFAVASRLFRRDAAPGKIGRQTQTWAPFSQAWGAVAAYVNIIDEPAG